MTEKSKQLVTRFHYADQGTSPIEAKHKPTELLAGTQVLPHLKWAKLRCAGCRRPARVCGFYHCHFTKNSFGRMSEAEYDLFLCTECGFGYMYQPWQTPYFSRLGRLDKSTLIFAVTYK